MTELNRTVYPWFPLIRGSEIVPVPQLFCLACLKELFLLATFPSQVELVRMKRRNRFSASAPTTKRRQIQPTVGRAILRYSLLEKSPRVSGPMEFKPRLLKGQLSRYQAGQEKTRRQERVGRLQAFC